MLFQTKTLSAACCAFLFLAASAQGQVKDKVDPIRTADIQSRGVKTFYAPDHFDLSGLPAFVPGAQSLKGTIRFWGSPYLKEGKLMDYWEEGFHKYYPKVRFEYHLPDSLTALGGVYTGAGEIGIGPKLTWNDYSAFIHSFTYDPTEIQVATGSYNVLGWNPAFGVYVNAMNPIDKINYRQLDGIFGAEREGGWVGFTWHPEFARGPEGNLRTWGQLGLKDDWADKPIHVYWLNLRYHMSETISNRLLKGSDKWNEQTRMYANRHTPEGKMEIASEQIMKEVAKDPYGITISSAAWESPETKGLAVSEGDDGPYVPMNMETVQNRTYPLADELYMYLNHDPAKPMKPILQEFLRFVVSREGQDAVVRDGKYLPLTTDLAKVQMQKLR